VLGLRVLVAQLVANMSILPLSHYLCAPLARSKCVELHPHWSVR
jgi:hypothetical protein